MKKIIIFACVMFFVGFSPFNAFSQNPKLVFDLLNQNSKSDGAIKSSSDKQYKVVIQMGGSFLNLQYNAGETPSFDFTPPPGIVIQAVYNNGVNVTSKLVNNVYTLAPIKENVLLLITTALISSFSVVHTPINAKVSGLNLKIKIKDLAVGEKIELFNLTGELISSVLCSNNLMTLTVERPGLYIIRIQNKCYKLIL